MPVQTPARQVSFRVQVSRSLHTVPSGRAGFEGASYELSHVAEEGVGQALAPMRSFVEEQESAHVSSDMPIVK